MWICGYWKNYYLVGIELFRLPLAYLSVVVASTTIFVMSCGTMPVPNLPQAQEIITAEVSSDTTYPQTSLPPPMPTQESPSTSVSEPEKSDTMQAVVDSDVRDIVPSQNIPDVSKSAVDTQHESSSITGVSDITANSETQQQIEALIQQPAVITIFPAKNSEVPEFPILTANDRVQNAIELLNHGYEKQAQKELADALVIEPNNRAARKLMRQIHGSDTDFFSPEEYFEYRLRKNETLMSVAKKFLNNSLDFYMLAKLNKIKIPADLTAGMTLKIPRTQNSANISEYEPAPLEVKREVAEHKTNETEIKFERAKVYYAEHRYQEAIDLINQSFDDKNLSKNPPLRELLVANYRDYSKSLIEKGNLLAAQSLLENSVKVLPENEELIAQLLIIKKDAEAEQLYAIGIEEFNKGKDEQALKTLSDALKLNPNHTQARKQIADLKLTVIESYHKKAMVLYRKQELSQAIQIWDEILQLDPNYDLAKQYKARALELKRRIEQL